MEYFTKTQACRLLGITMPTLNLCLKKLREQGHDLMPIRDPYNPHLVLLSSDQIEVVRQFRGAYLARLPLKAIAAPPRLPQLPAAAPTALESQHSASQGHPERIPLPDGWVSLAAFAGQHGIYGRDYGKRHDICVEPISERGWWDGRGWVKWVLDEMGQQRFIEAFRHHKDYKP